MKYVGVKHKDNQPTVYWFVVPDNIEKYVSIGTKVVCNTRRGDADGIVVMLLDGIEQESVKSIIGNHFPLKNIVGVYMDMKLSDIHIPWDTYSSNPSAYKIAKRVLDLYTSSEFNTRVLFSLSGDLLDGYTAYLVSKMFDRETLSGLCITDER